MYKKQLMDSRRTYIDNIRDVGADVLSMSRDADRIIIYGMGLVGHRFITIIRDYFTDKEVVVWDINAANLAPVKLGARLLEILEPDFESCNSKDAVYFCVADSEALEEVKAKFSEKGVVNFLDIAGGGQMSAFTAFPCIDNGLPDPKICSECSLLPSCNVKYFDYYYNYVYLKNPQQEDAEYDVKMLSHINRLVLPFTHVCNLYCDGCVYTSKQYRENPHRLVEPDVDSIIKLIDKLSSVTELIDRIIIGTGEPFLYQDQIIQVAEHIFDNPRIQSLFIITNGIIPIKQELYDLLSQNKRRVVFQIDDYYLKHGNTKELIEMLKSNGFFVMIINADSNQWYDLCDVSEHDVDDDIFNTCRFAGPHGFSLLNGRLYPHCGLQSQKEILLNGAVSKDYFDSDSVNVMTTPREELADAIINLHNNMKKYKACRYCVMSQPEPKKIPCSGRVEFKKDHYEKFLKKSSEV